MVKDWHLYNLWVQTSMTFRVFLLWPEIYTSIESVCLCVCYIVYDVSYNQCIKVKKFTICSKIINLFRKNQKLVIYWQHLPFILITLKILGFYSKIRFHFSNFLWNLTYQRALVLYLHVKIYQWLMWKLKDFTISNFVWCSFISLNTNKLKNY